MSHPQMWHTAGRGTQHHTPLPCAGCDMCEDGGSHVPRTPGFKAPVTTCHCRPALPIEVSQLAPAASSLPLPSLLLVLCCAAGGDARKLKALSLIVRRV